MTERALAPAEAVLVRLFLPVCVLSGAVLVAGFFFPSLAGEVIPPELWLALALTFFGAGLGYLALLPAPTAEADDAEVAPGYLLRIAQLGTVGAIRGFVRRQDPFTFGLPLAAVAVFLLGQAIVPGEVAVAAGDLETLLLQDLGWVFIVPMLLALLFCVVVLLGPWGDIKLGGADAEPTYSYPVYFTLIFTAGIAAGIVFWGPAEALFHYDTPPPFVDTAAHTDEAVAGALMYSLFHWGVSAWAAYLVLGVPIAYYTYQRGAPLRVSAVLTPILGRDHLDHPVARLVDVLAVFVTIGGIATSVALVSQQFLTGVDFQWDLGVGSIGPVLFVTGLTVVFVLSAQSGVHRGIRRLANVNILLFIGLLVVLVAVGPRSTIASDGAAATGAYVTNFLPMSLEFGHEWAADWTVWNWVWWFSWAPFAGLFIAALSHGRRLRSVVFTGLVATALATMAWFIVLGTTALELQHAGEVDILSAMAAGGGEDVAAFPLFDALPLGEVLIFLMLALIIVFMATSADTSTLVVSILSTRHGRAPTTATIVFWGVAQGAIAVIVLLTGTEAALQTAAVLLGGPVALVAVVSAIGFASSCLRHERGHRSLLAAARDRLSSLRGRFQR